MDAKQYGNRPAFPHAAMKETFETAAQHPGMTVREVFAGLALQGLLANPYYAQEAADGQHSGTIEAAARYHADELIAELAKVGAA